MSNTIVSLIWHFHLGYCVVDETERGWYCQYIDRKPEAIERQKALEKKEKMAVTDEEKIMLLIEKQRERAGDSCKPEKEPEYTELKRDETSEEKVTFSLGSTKDESHKRLFV